MGFSPEDSRTLSYHKTPQGSCHVQAVCRKNFISEYEMFTRGDLSNGEPYARIMKQYTGFYYQPESHLFDLAPELYCLDYILGWMAETVMENYLVAKFGTHWMFAPETGQILKGWWAQGNQYDLPRFLAHNGLGEMSAEAMVNRWEKGLE